MGSVIVTWSGRCDDRDTRAKLGARIADFGARLHRHFPEPPSVRMRTAERHVGQIVIERGVFDAGDDLAGLTNAFEATASGLPFKLCNPAVPEPLDVDEDLVAVSEVTLDGVEFRLYDGRSLYPEDRVSFVFARIGAHPNLGWRLVKVEDRSRCATSDNAVVCNADLYLSRPNIHLRYYCEEWMDFLLAAIKIFFVRDLAYWRHEPLMRFDAISAEIARLDRDDAEDVVFAYLDRLFETEVGKWRETASQARAFWAAMRNGMGTEEKEG